jgi:hypothetical protein
MLLRHDHDEAADALPVGPEKLPFLGGRWELAAKTGR